MPTLPLVLQVALSFWMVFGKARTQIRQMEVAGTSEKASRKKTRAKEDTMEEDAIFSLKKLPGSFRHKRKHLGVLVGSVPLAQAR